MQTASIIGWFVPLKFPLSDAIDKKLGPARIPLAGHQAPPKHALGTTQNALRISGDTLVG